MNLIKREFVAVGAGSAVLVGLAVLTSLSFPVVLGISVAAYLGARMVLPSPAEEEVAEGVTRSQLQETVNEIRKQAARFDHFGDRLRKPMRQRVRHIAQLVRDIITHLRRDPTHLNAAVEFLEFHLPKALRIVETFTVLSEQKHLDEVGRQHLEEAEKTIGLIEKAFTAQHSRMMASDVEAFDMDRRVYEELLRLDGEIDTWADDGFEEAGRLSREGTPPISREP